MQLSPHFTLAELTRTEVREPPNVPREPQVKNLRRLAMNVLEPMRDLYVPRLGCHVGALSIRSGFRCPEVNAAVKGDPQSAHMDGRAADLHPVNPEVLVFDLMVALVKSSIPFSRAIYERPRQDVWLHVQISTVNGAAPEKRLLKMCLRPGVYLDWNPEHPRIVRPEPR